MEEKQNKKKEDKPENLVGIPVRIIDDGKQLSVRIPKQFAEALDINPQTDVFVFLLDKENLHLEGFLEDKEKFEKEEINGHD
jgi:hypothetical protein